MGKTYQNRSTVDLRALKQARKMARLDNPQGRSLRDLGKTIGRSFNRVERLADLTYSEHNDE